MELIDTEIYSLSDDATSPLAIYNSANNCSSSFNAVVFHNVMHQYPIDAHVECHFVWSEDVQPKFEDWVGLFKVGWTSTRNYLTYSYVKLGENFEKTRTGRAFFMNKDLPKEEYEFYQFCYITANGLVKGASTPFRFYRPICEDLITEDGGGEDKDMLIVTSRTIAMENRLHRVNIEKEELASALERLELLRQEAESRCVRLCEEKAVVLSELQEAHLKLTLSTKTAAEILDIQKRLELLAQRNENQKVELTDVKSQLTAAQVREAEMTEKLTEVGTMQSRLAELQFILTSSSKKYDEQTELLHQVSHKAELLERELMDARKQLSCAENETKLRKVELIALEQEIRQCASERDALNEQVKELNDRLKNETNERLLLSDTDKLLRAEEALRQTAELRCVRLERELIEERNSNDERQSESRTELAQLKCRYQCLEQAYAAVKERCLRVERRSDTAREQLSDMVALNRELLAREEALTKRCSNLEQRLCQGANEYKKLASQLRHSASLRSDCSFVYDNYSQLDAVSDKLDLDEPLKPLPPPIEPLRTAAALRAEMQLHNAVAASNDQSTPLIKRDAIVLLEDEQFHDASDEPQASQKVICPVCDFSFSTDDANYSAELEKHVSTHFTPAAPDSKALICPLCQDKMPLHYSHDMYEAHVNNHFNN